MLSIIGLPIFNALQRVPAEDNVASNHLLRFFGLATGEGFFLTVFDFFKVRFFTGAFFLAAGFAAGLLATGFLATDTLATGFRTIGFLNTT